MSSYFKIAFNLLLILCCSIAAESFAATPVSYATALNCPAKIEVVCAKGKYIRGWCTSLQSSTKKIYATTSSGKRITMKHDPYTHADVKKGVYNLLTYYWGGPQGSEGITCRYEGGDQYGTLAYYVNANERTLMQKCGCKLTASTSKFTCTNNIDDCLP